MTQLKAIVRQFSFTGATVWNVKLPKGGILERHRHAWTYRVHPLRAGRVRLRYYGDDQSQKCVEEEVKDLVPGEPYEVVVPQGGIWVEVVNEGDDTEWDKDEPEPRP